MPIQDNGNRDIVTVVLEQRENGNTDYGVLRRPDADKASTMSQLMKVAIAITIFGAASYGEGWVNYMALVALFLVYLLEIG